MTLRELLQGRRVLEVDESRLDQEGQCLGFTLTLDDGKIIEVETVEEFCPGDCSVSIAYKAKGDSQ